MKLKIKNKMIMKFLIAKSKKKVEITKKLYFVFRM